MKIITAFAGTFLLFSAVSAMAAPPLVNPVTINVGTPVHLTPIDQDSNPIPIAQCTIVNLPATIATFAKDSTGVVLTAAAPGSYAGVRIQCSDGVNPAVQSPAFTVTVPTPPYSVTAVGSTSP